MKKFIFCLVAAVATMGLMANGLNQDNSQAEMISETTCVHETCVECETHVGSEGFGRCLKSGCNCKAFEGRGETCRNCGHAYNKHY